MPDSITGFTGTEITARVRRYVGSTSNDFITFVNNTLPLVEAWYYHLHDWQFLHKTALSLAVTEGTDEYDLSVANIGFYMAATDVETIYDETAGIVLKRLDLNQIRRFDPQNDDGTASSGPSIWTPAGDNRIHIYPPTFGTRTLKIDGKIFNPQLTTLSNTPLMPFRYQQSFIQAVIAVVLDRENDDRFESKKAEVAQLIRSDIQDDMRQLSDTENDRIRSLREARFDGAGANIEALLLGFLSDFDHF